MDSVRISIVLYMKASSRLYLQNQLKHHLDHIIYYPTGKCPSLVLQNPPGRLLPTSFRPTRGENPYYPRSTVRVLALAKESEDSISVFHFDDVLGDPVGFHHHNEAHDILYVPEVISKYGQEISVGSWSLGAFAQCPPPGNFTDFPTMCEVLISPTESHPPTPASGPLEGKPWPCPPQKMGRLFPLCLGEI